MMRRGGRMKGDEGKCVEMDHLILTVIPRITGL